MTSYDELAARLAHIETMVAGRNVPQLAHSAIDGGAIRGKDIDGVLGSIIGEQWDGSHGAVPVNGPVPPQPNPPAGAPVVGGIRVRVDGTWASGAFTVAPMDFKQFEIHLGTTADFEPDLYGAPRHEFASARGGEAVLAVSYDTDYWLRAAARTQTGKMALSTPVGPFRAIKLTPAELDVDFEAITGTKVWYGPDTPADPEVGDLWLREIPGSDPPKYEPLRRIEGDAWQVLQDKDAAQALADAVAAAQAAQDAADVAAGRMQLFVQDDMPADLAAGESGSWIDTGDSNRAYTWNGAAWVSRRLGNGAIEPNSLVANDVIATGTVTAALLETTLVLSTTVIAGDPNGTHVRLTPTGLRVFRLDPVDGSLDEVIRLGTDTDDYFAIIDALGKLVASIDHRGVAAFTGLSVTEDPRFGGVLLSERLDRKAQIDAWTGEWARTGPTTDEIGMIEIAWMAKLGHTYAIHAAGLIPVVAGGDDFIVVFRMRASFDGSSPFSGSYIMGSSQVRTKSAASPWENPSCTVHGLHHELVGDRLVRVVLTVAKPPAATSIDIYDDNVISRRFFWVEDLGTTPGDTGQVNTAGGTRVVGQPPPPPAPPAKVDGETIFTPGWVRSFTGGGAVQSTTAGYQGQSPNNPANGNMRSFWGQFRDNQGRTFAQALAGASVRFVKVWAYYDDWYRNDGGQPLIGFHTNDAAPAGPTGQYSDVIAQAKIPQASGIEANMDPGWGNLMRDGQVMGVALGPAPSTDPIYRGRANSVLVTVGWTR